MFRLALQISPCCRNTHDHQVTILLLTILLRPRYRQLLFRPQSAILTTTCRHHRPLLSHPHLAMSATTCRHRRERSASASPRPYATSLHARKWAPPLLCPRRSCLRHQIRYRTRFYSTILKPIVYIALFSSLSIMRLIMKMIYQLLIFKFNIFFFFFEGIFV